MMIACIFSVSNLGCMKIASRLVVILIALFLGRSDIFGAAFTSKFGQINWILLRKRTQGANI